MLPLHWQHPHLLWLILPLLAYAWYLRQHLQNVSAWSSVADPKLIEPLLLAPKQPKRLGYGMLALVWLSAIVALAGPSWHLVELPLYQNHQATVLITSLNDTMLANDLAPTRLARMHYKLLDSLKRYGDGQVGLIAFAGEAYVVSPLTQDSQTIVNFVGDLTPDVMPVAGNNLSAALKLAARMLHDSNQQQGRIIVFTADGADASAIDTAKTLASQGITISVLGMATPLGAPLLSHTNGKVIMSRLDASSLSALASAGDGQFQAFTSDNSDLSRLFTASPNTPHLPGNISAVSQACQPRFEKTCINTFRFWHNQGYWLVWLCIPFVLLAFRRGSPWLNLP